MNDVRELLELAKSDPPPVRATVDDIVVAGRRRARRRVMFRSVGALGGTAVVAVAVVAAVAVAPGRAPEETPNGTQVAADPAASFSTTFRGYSVGDFAVADPLQVTPAYERTLVRRSNLDVGGGPPITVDAGELTVYRAGAFVPGRFTGGTKVEVKGREGWAATLPVTILVGGPDKESRTNPTSQTVEVPALAWQYAAGAWATIVAASPGERGVPAENQRQLAERFTTTAGTAVTLPFRLTNLPAGWTLGSAGPGSLVAGTGEIALAYYVPSTTGFAGSDAPLDLNSNKTPAIRVSVQPVETEGPFPHPVSPPCPSGEHFCDVRVGDRFYAEVHDQSGSLSEAELRAIADGLRFADPTNPGTWFPAS